MSSIPPLANAAAETSEDLAAPVRPPSGRKAVSWILAGFGGAQVLRLISNVVLARLLEPEIFALMALANAILQGAAMFSDTGVGVNIVQSKRGTDPVFVNTAWTVQVIRGTFLWLVLALLAWPMSRVYDRPELVPVLVAIGSATFLTGLISTSILLLRRRMEMKISTFFDLFTQAVQVLVMTVWAVISPTVWALVAGSIVSGLLTVIWSHLIRVGPRNKFVWDRESLVELRSFGQWVFLGTAMSFLALHSDKLILAKMLAPAVFGVYTIAAALATMPDRLVRRIAVRIVFPALAAQRDLPRERVKATYMKQRRKLLLLVGLLASGGAVLGDLPVRLLYTEQYQAAAWMFPLLSIGVWISGVSVSSDSIPLAFGRSVYSAGGSIARFSFVAVCLPLAAQSMGVLGAVIVMATAGLPNYVVGQFALKRLDMRMFAQDVRSTLAFLAVCAFGVWLRAQLGFPHPLVDVLASGGR